MNNTSFKATTHYINCYNIYTRAPTPELPSFTGWEILELVVLNGCPLETLKFYTLMFTRAGNDPIEMGPTMGPTQKKSQLEEETTEYS